MKRIATAMILLLAAGPAIAQGPPPASVRLDPVRAEQVDQRREVTGDLRAVRRSAVASKEQGLVVGMTVEVGDRVAAGDPIATLDAQLLRLTIRALEADVEAKSAAIAERRAQLTDAERDLRLITELRARSGASQNEVDTAKTEVDAAAARLAQAVADADVASAELARARQRVEDMTVRAPYDGFIVGKETELGEWVDAGDLIVDLVAVGSVDAWIDVPEQFIGGVASSAADVQIRIPALDETRPATSVAVIAAGDALARTFPVRVRLANPGFALRPGMSVIGLVPTGTVARAITVHKDAIIRDDAGAFVYMDAGGTAVPVRISPMYAVGDRVVVRGDALQPGMHLVVEGNERLFPGTPLVPMNGAATTAPPAGAGAGS